jgi:hypothetical protein
MPEIPLLSPGTDKPEPAATNARSLPQFGALEGVTGDERLIQRSFRPQGEPTAALLPCSNTVTSAQTIILPAARLTVKPSPGELLANAASPR